MKKIIIVLFIILGSCNPYKREEIKVKLFYEDGTTEILKYKQTTYARNKYGPFLYNGCVYKTRDKSSTSRIVAYLDAMRCGVVKFILLERNQIN